MFVPWRGKAALPTFQTWADASRRRGAAVARAERAKEMMMLHNNRLRLTSSLLATALFVASAGMAAAAGTGSQSKTDNQTTTSATNQTTKHKAMKKQQATRAKSRHESAIDAKERAETKALNEEQLNKHSS